MRRWMNVVVLVLVAGAWPAVAAEGRTTAAAPVTVVPDDFAVTVARARTGATESYVSGDDATVTVDGDVELGRLDVRVRPDGETPYRFSFAAPLGEPLREQRYDDTGDLRTAEHAEHSVGLQGYACGDPRGVFEVHRLTSDLSQVWVTFANSCGDVVGEVRVGVPPAEESVRAVPSRLQWGPRATGSRSGPVQVRFTNTEAGPRRLRGVALDRGRAHYRIADSDCRGVLLPGESCTAGVVVAPVGRGDRPRPGRLVLRGEDGSGPTVVTRVSLRTEGLGGWWGLRAWDDDGTTYDVGPTRMAYASLGAGQVIDAGTGDSDGPRLDIRVVPPRGERLVEGRTYEGGDPADPARRREAEMDVGTQGEGCRGTGRFTVHEIEYDERDRLDRLSMTFVWNCPGSVPNDVRGTVAVHATAPPPKPGPQSRVALLRGPTTRWRGGEAVVDRRSPLRTSAAPNTPWRQGCVDFTLQRRSGTSWRTVDGGGCRVVGRNGLARHEVPAGRFGAGTQIRLRGTWRAPDFPTVRSRWQRTRVVARAP